MKINIRALILDLEGDPMQEPKINKSTGEVQWDYSSTEFSTLEEAYQAGERLVVLDDAGKVVRRLPQLENVSLQRICVHALIRTWEGEQLGDEEMFDRWMLARRLREELDSDGCIELEKDERETIVGATDHYALQNRVYFSRAREMLDVKKFKKKAATPTPPAMMPPNMPMQ